MTNKEILGLLMRDDQFLIQMSQNKEQIRQLWLEQIGEDKLPENKVQEVKLDQDLCRPHFHFLGSMRKKDLGWR